MYIRMYMRERENSKQRAKNNVAQAILYAWPIREGLKLPDISGWFTECTRAGRRIRGLHLLRLTKFYESPGQPTGEDLFQFMLRFRRSLCSSAGRNYFTDRSRAITAFASRSLALFAWRRKLYDNGVCIFPAFRFIKQKASCGFPKQDGCSRRICIRTRCFIASRVSVFSEIRRIVWVCVCRGD